jgi:curved DNA-binding protein CbpA
MNPYLVLGVPLDADDQTIRRAYLEAVKISPPDHEPRRFQAVSAAYEKIKDQPSRHRYTLFDRTPMGDTPLEVFFHWAQSRRQFQPLPLSAMKEFLRACSKS